MRPMLQPTCFTRVVVDGVEDVEIAQLHSVELRIRECLQHIPEAQRRYIENALLNLALHQWLAGTDVRQRHC